MKSVVITGAFGGMGMAASKLLAEKGYRVFALDREIRPAEKNIIPMQTDVTSEASIRWHRPSAAMPNSTKATSCP